MRSRLRGRIAKLRHLTKTNPSLETFMFVFGLIRFSRGKGRSGDPMTR